LSPTTSPPGSSPGSKGSTAHGRSRSAPQPFRIDDKPQLEIIDGKQVERIGTIALGIDNKGCVDIAHANGVTKLSKHLDIKHKYF
jgi:hypothetical protein